LKLRIKDKDYWKYYILNNKHRWTNLMFTFHFTKETVYNLHWPKIIAGFWKFYPQQQEALSPAVKRASAKLQVNLRCAQVIRLSLAHSKAVRDRTGYNWLQKVWRCNGERALRELKNIDSMMIEKRTHVDGNFFDRKYLDTNPLQWCPQIMKHPV
jgi:hypothetical protein